MPLPANVNRSRHCARVANIVNNTIGYSMPCSLHKNTVAGTISNATIFDLVISSIDNGNTFASILPNLFGAIKYVLMGSILGINLLQNDIIAFPDFNTRTKYLDVLEDNVILFK